MSAREAFDEAINKLKDTVFKLETEGRIMQEPVVIPNVGTVWQMPDKRFVLEQPGVKYKLLFDKFEYLLQELTLHRPAPDVPQDGVRCPGCGSKMPYVTRMRTTYAFYNWKQDDMGIFTIDENSENVDGVTDEPVIACPDCGLVIDICDLPEISQVSLR